MPTPPSIMLVVNEEHRFLAALAAQDQDPNAVGEDDIERFEDRYERK